jgi:hypothetical protein
VAILGEVLRGKALLHPKPREKSFSQAEALSGFQKERFEFSMPLPKALGINLLLHWAAEKRKNYWTVTEP